jgi:hypothetical protein
LRTKLNQQGLTMPLRQALKQPITLILAVAFMLRLGYGMGQDPLQPYDRAGSGGDEWWYLEFGFRQVVDVQMEPLSTAPLYVLLVGASAGSSNPPAMKWCGLRRQKGAVPM